MKQESQTDKACSFLVRDFHRSSRDKDNALNTGALVGSWVQTPSLCNRIFMPSSQFYLKFQLSGLTENKSHQDGGGYPVSHPYPG